MLYLCCRQSQGGGTVGQWTYTNQRGRLAMVLWQQLECLCLRLRTCQRNLCQMFFFCAVYEYERVPASLWARDTARSTELLLLGDGKVPPSASCTVIET